MSKTGTKVAAALLVLLLIISVLFISTPVRSRIPGLHSSMLKQVTEQEGNTVRTDYVNEDGEITVAADLGYATLLITKNKNTQLEQYYDDQGRPTARYLMDFGVFREYDENGNNIRITHLNAWGRPAAFSGGYAIEEREYNQSGQIITTRYLDADGMPKQTKSYGYGKINEYNDQGYISKITYTDASGQPMMTGQGYAIVCRNYYESDGPESGRAGAEFYFDAAGNPVSLALGQYGVHFEYDKLGRATVRTYLDAEGNPTVTKEGYTTVTRTFRADNSIETEKYYDLEGKPFAFSEGQYGIKKEAGQTFYLDENGNEQFNLKRLLYNQSRLVIVFAMAAIAASVCAGKKLNILFLIIYLAAICYMTLLFRENEKTGINLRLFWSYRRILRNSRVRADILKNIWLFIPLGAILYKLCPRCVILLVPVMLSAAIEGVQYITGTGLCELDDIISNSLGGIIGYETGRLLTALKHILLKKKGKNAGTTGQE